jgi:hypothetical protein
MVQQDLVKRSQPVILFSNCNETNSHGGIPWIAYVLVYRLHLRCGGRGHPPGTSITCMMAI